MKSRNTLLGVLILAVCLTQFAADIYAPSISFIASDFDVSIDNIQWSMSVYMLGVALSQLIYGPISEGVGRKPLLLLGLFIMGVGSVVSYFSTAIEMLVWGRFIQGCGAGACASLWRSVFRDAFTSDELAKYSSYFVIFIMFIVPSAPLLGGYLQAYFDWRASFVFMTVYSVVALIGIAFGFEETNTKKHIDKLKMHYIFSRYGILLKSPLFIGITASTFLSYGAFFAWFVVGPVLLIDIAGITPIAFGWLTFFGGGGAYALAGYLNGRFVKRFGMSSMMRFGWTIMILSGCLLGIGYSIFGVTSWSVLIPVILFYFGSTFIWPNAFAQAFTPFGEIAGYAAALYGFMQICGGATIAGLICYLPDKNQLPLAVVMLGCSICAWVIYELSIFVDNKQKNL